MSQVEAADSQAADPEHEAQHRAHFTKLLSEKRGGGIGFAGAHRTGKSTLAAAMAESNPGIPFVKTSTREIAKHFGYDVGATDDFDARLTFQEYVLIHHVGIWEKERGLFFTDRTPLDFAGYMLTFAPTGEIDPFQEHRLMTYLDRCAQAAKDHFMTLFCIQPGIPYVPAEGVPPPNKAYQEKMNALVIGFARSYVSRPFYVMDREVTNIDRRMDITGKVVAKELGNYQSMLNWLPKN